MNYQQRKAQLVEEAKDFQALSSVASMSYGELAQKTNYFERMGKRYGLLKEFKINGII